MLVFKGKILGNFQQGVGLVSFPLDSSILFGVSLTRFEVRIFFFAHTCPTKFHRPGLKRKGCKGRAGGVFLCCL